MDVSVIVAAYNVSRSIDATIQSLRNQTFRDFEIVIVDDGSTDGTSQLCDRYAKIDKRIRVIHKSNGGVSAARQTGLDAAVGEYIIHADADDYVEPQMLECLYEKAKQDDADVVICDYYRHGIDGSIDYIKQQPPTTADSALRALFQQLHGSCCNKLARRVCYSRYDIRFPQGLNYCEDLLTWVQMFQHPEIRISYLSQAFYHYMPNPSSITRAGSLKQLAQIRLFTEKMADLLPKGDKEIEAYVATLPIAPFQYALQHRLVSDAESRAEYKRLRRVIWNDTRSLRWKLGYLCMDLNMMRLARMLVKL